MTHTKTCIRAAGKLFAVLVSIIATFASVGTASAAPNELPPASGALSVESSMRHDPDAIACLKAACSSDPLTIVEGTGMSARELKIGQCKSDHLKRVGNTLSRRQGMQLEAQPFAAPPPYAGAFTCEALTGKPDELGVKLNELETQKVALIDEAKQNPPKPPVEVAAATSDDKKPSAPAVLSVLKDEGDGVSVIGILKKDPILTVPAPVAVAWGSDPCLPPHFRVVSMDTEKAVLYVEAGADYVSLSRSCFAKTYDTDPREIIEANSIERTIPYCDKDGKRTFDPERYDLVLSGKKKLVWGDPANKAFLDECEKGGGTVGVALQGRQWLTLLAFDDPSEPGTDDAPATPKKKHASLAPTPKKSDLTAPVGEEVEKLASHVFHGRWRLPGDSEWDFYADEGEVRYAVLNPPTSHPVETMPSSIRSDTGRATPVQGEQATWPPPRPPPPLA